MTVVQCTDTSSFKRQSMDQVNFGKDNEDAGGSSCKA